MLRYYLDPTYILVIIGIIISMAASANVNGSFRKYSRISAKRGIRAEQAADMILRAAGIFDVRIERIRGNLTDHYDPRSKTLRLSDTVYGSVNFASSISMPMILLGLLLGYIGLAKIGVLLFSAVLIFQLVTLPVEFNASSRALHILAGSNILYDDEIGSARKVLRAAALTYVASVLATALQLFRLILIVNRRNN